MKESDQGKRSSKKIRDTNQGQKIKEKKQGKEVRDKRSRKKNRDTRFRDQISICGATDFVVAPQISLRRHRFLCGATDFSAGAHR